MLTSRGRYALLLALAAAGPARGQVTFLDSIGAAGAAGTTLAQPLGLAVAPDGRLFVADSGNNRVRVYAQPAGSVGFGLTATLTNGGSPFSQPADVAVGADGSLFVSDTGNNRVVRFAPAGDGFTQQAVLGAGVLSGPAGLAVAPGGAVLVADAGNNRLATFPAGGGTATFSANTGAGATDLPLGVAVAADGTRYVADTNNARVAAYAADGTFLGARGTGLVAPIDLSLAPSGDLYLADGGDGGTPGRVRVLAADGTARFDFGANDLNNPSDVAVARTGQIFVSDTLNNRVARYFNPAEWVAGTNTFNAPVAGAGQLLGQNLTLNPGMTLNALGGLTVQAGAALTVAGGVLNATGPAAVAGTLTVRAGSTAGSTGLVTVQAGGRLAGDGTLAAPVTVAGAVRPGTAAGGPATLRTGNLTLAAGGAYEWTVSRAAGTAGTDWSLLLQAGTNTLTVGSTAADRFTIRLQSAGPLADFDPLVARSFTLASFSAISGFSPDKFAVDTTGFAPSLPAGAFSVSASGGNLLLNYTPVPEPALLLAAAALTLAAARRTRR